MAHHLNTNKQFMVGNGILAFAVIFVVVIFIYMSLRLQRENQAERHYIETYTISLIANQVMQEEAFTVEVGRFAEQSALMIVDNKTEIASVFDLSEKGGTYQFEKETDGIKQLAK